jgi:hypothetical protein
MSPSITTAKITMPKMERKSGMPSILRAVALNAI